MMATHSPQGMYASMMRFGLLPETAPKVHATQIATTKKTVWYLSSSCRRYEYDEIQHPKVRHAPSIVTGPGFMAHVKLSGNGKVLKPISASSPCCWSRKSVKYCKIRGLDFASTYINSSFVLKGITGCDHGRGCCWENLPQSKERSTWVSIRRHGRDFIWKTIDNITPHWGDRKDGTSTGRDWIWMT